MDLLFNLFVRIISFLSFTCQNVNMPGLSTIQHHFRQRVEGQKLVDHRTLAKLWEKTFKYYSASQLYSVYCGFMAISVLWLYDYMSKDSKKLQSPLKTPGRYIMLLYCSCVFDKPLSIFSLHYSCVHFHYTFFKVINNARYNYSP